MECFIPTESRRPSLRAQLLHSKGQATANLRRRANLLGIHGLIYEALELCGSLQPAASTRALSAHFSRTIASMGSEFRVDVSADRREVTRRCPCLDSRPAHAPRR